MVEVIGDSMEPKLHGHDRILVITASFSRGWSNLPIALTLNVIGGDFIMLHALVIAAVLAAAGMARGDDDDGCDFAPPSPALRENAYAGQSFALTGHTAVETAELGDGVTLTLNQNQCVDMWEKADYRH